MRKIMTIVIVSLMLGILGVCIYHTNRVCRDRYHEVTVPDGRLELNGLRYEVGTGRLYDTEALLAAYPDLYMNADNYTTGERLGKEYQLITEMQITNISGEEIDISDILEIDDIQSGAWTNGTDPYVYELSPMYADEKEKLQPGESTTVLLETNLLATYMKSMEVDTLYHRTFYAVLSFDDGVQCQHYYLAFRPDGYTQATKSDQEQFAEAVLQAEERRKQQETAYADDAEDEEDAVPEDTKERFTKMGEEFVREGIGYTVVKAQLSDDVTKLDVDQDPSKWQDGVLPPIKYDDDSMYRKYGCYTYVEIRIHNYHKKPHTLFYDGNSSFYCSVGSERLWDKEESSYYDSPFDADHQVYCVDLTTGTVSDYDTIPMEIAGETTDLFGICYFSSTVNSRDEWNLRSDPNLHIMHDVQQELAYEDQTFPMILLDQLEVR